MTFLSPFSHDFPAEGGPGRHVGPDMKFPCGGAGDHGAEAVPDTGPRVPQKLTDGRPSKCITKKGKYDGRGIYDGKNELYFWGIEKKSGKLRSI